MKKLNNKGIGHHLLLLAVAVMAVVGASGYFVWQRQKNNDINAQASSYTYTDLSTVQPIGSSGSINSPKVAWYACKIAGGTSTNSIYAMAKYAVGKGPTVRVGVGTSKKVLVSRDMNNSALTLPRFQLRNASEFMVQGEFRSGPYIGNVSRTTYSINSIGDCFTNTVTPAPNKYTDLSTLQPIGASGSVGSATVSWFACKNVVTDTSFTISTIAKYAVGSGPSVKVSAGYGKMVLVSEIMTNSAMSLPEFGLKNMDEFMVQSEFTSGPDINVTRLSYKISELGACK